MFLITEGSEFHNLGAAVVNDLSPIVAEDFFHGGMNNIAFIDPTLCLVLFTKMPRSHV